MKITNWKVSVLNPANKNVLEVKTFRNIEDISIHYPLIPLATWRNISIGRSKIYDNFIKLEKIILENSINNKEISTYTDVKSDYETSSSSNTSDE